MSIKRIFLYFFLFTIITLSFSCSKSKPRMTLDERMTQRAKDIERKKLFFLKISLLQKINISVPENTPFYGNQNAKNEIILFSDFLCPFCEYLDIKLLDFVKKNKSFKIYYVIYPLDAKCNPLIGSKGFHKGSCDISTASLVAYQKGEFWDFFESYNKTKKLSGKNALNSLLEKYSIDNKINAKKLAVQVKQNIRLAHKLGIYTTPTFFINGKEIVGVRPITWIEELLSKQL